MISPSGVSVTTVQLPAAQVSRRSMTLSASAARCARFTSPDTALKSGASALTSAPSTMSKPRSGDVSNAVYAETSVPASDRPS